MDGKAGKLELLGAFGIVAELIRILRRCQQIIGVITLTLILPLSLVALLHNWISLPLSAKLVSDELNSLTSEDVNEGGQSDWILPVFVVWEIVYGVLVDTLSGLLTAVMVSIVASFYSGKQEPFLAKLTENFVMTGKRKLITSLWVFFLLLLNIISLALAVRLLIWSLSQFSVISNRPFKAALILVIVVFVRVLVNINVVWKLACVVCVVEEKCYGLEGVKKSLCLIDEKDSSAWLLTLMCLVFDCGFSYAVVRGNRDALDFGTIIVMLHCGVVMTGPMTQSVLYFVCKSYHGESVHKLWVLGQMKDFYPLE